jgi:hypothetical protein
MKAIDNLTWKEVCTIVSRLAKRGIRYTLDVEGPMYRILYEVDPGALNCVVVWR